MMLLSRLVLALLSVLALAHLLPNYVGKMFPRDYATVLMAYSAGQERMIFRDFRSGNWSYRDSDGNPLTEAQVREALPFFYMPDLKRLGQLPERVADWSFDADELARHSTRMRLVPRHLDKAGFGLYTLMESVPGPGGLVSPPDMFRMGKRIEFIDAGSNRVNEEKSRRFNQALETAGFVHPAKLVGDSADTRKMYDNGALLLDAEGRLFHVWQRSGEPVVTATNTVIPDTALSIRVLHLPGREYHGIVTLPDQHLFLDWKDHAVRALPLKEHDALNEFVAVEENPLYWEFSYTRDGSGVRRFVLADRQLQPVLQHTEHEDADDARKRVIRSNTLGFLFPFKLDFRLSDSSQHSLSFNTFDAHWWVILAGRISALCVFLAWYRKRSQHVPHGLDMVFVLCTGWLGAITLAVLGPLISKPVSANAGSVKTAAV